MEGATTTQPILLLPEKSYWNTDQLDIDFENYKNSLKEELEILKKCLIKNKRRRELEDKLKYWEKMKKLF